MTKKIIGMLLVWAGLQTPALSQELAINGTLTGTSPEGMRLFVMPVMDNGQIQSDTVVIDGSRFRASTSRSPYNIYKIVCLGKERQIVLPVYLPKKGKTILKMSFSDEDPVLLRASNSSKALLAFNSFYTEKTKKLWMDGKTMSEDALKVLVNGYLSAADSIIRKYKPASSVEQYIQLWAAVITFETWESFKFVTGKETGVLGLQEDSWLKSLCKYIDNDMALSFDAVSRMVLANVKGKNLDTCIAQIWAGFKNKVLQDKAIHLLLSRYISTFNYTKNYEQGLQELTALTLKYQLNERYLSEFKARQASIIGVLFPENVTLYDTQGNKVDFGSYRGKYVYIDMWASWCMPCIKELPHLKRLEGELENKEVIFLSVSIDSDETAWKNKVKSLGLEGNQLMDKSGQLSKALNVGGIPFFLIYDKEGKLYRYNAYRPSDTRLKLLLESLK